MSVRLKQRVRGLVAVVALSMVTLVVLSGMVEAQEEYDAHALRTEGTQNADRNDAREEAAATATPQEAAYETTERLVVEPGDSLWSIAQERLGPNASPQQVANEVDRLYGLNRNAVGDDPDLIFPGQEFSLPPVGVAMAAEPAASEPAATAAEPATSESADEPLTEPASEPVAPPTSSGTQAPPTPSPEVVEPSPPSPDVKRENWISVLGRAHRLLGVGILFMAAILTLFLAWKAFSVRRSLRRDPKLRYRTSSVEPGVPESEHRFPILETPGSKRSPSDLQSTTTAEENGHHYRVGTTAVASIRRKGILGTSKRRWRKFLPEERPTVVRGRQVRRFLRYAPLRGAVATNERATGATLEVSRFSAKRKRKLRAAALAGSFAGSGRVAPAKGAQGIRKGPRKDLRDLKKAGG